ncbi:MAG: hypothetical protein IPK82_06970 [Polyangiaceae bacterium]|nr:hypothetical protein [Polyangiaceae bacterium]
MSARFKALRDVDRRICLEGVLELTSPCHLGGTDADATSEKPLVRDASGQPYLPGTTLTGLLRSAGSHMASAQADEALFGARWAQGEGDQAHLIVEDARIHATGTIPTELRDGVKIDPSTGTAEDGKKYDVELLPAGTRFLLRFELVVPEKSPHPMLSLFCELLLALEQGKIPLGARSRRGFGQAKVVLNEAGYRWNVVEYTTAAREGMLAWLARGLSDQESAGLSAGATDSCTSYPSAVQLAAAWKCTPASDIDRGNDNCFEVTLSLVSTGSLLVRSGGFAPGSPDAVHLARLHARNKRSLTPVLPGTSLAGVLRHRCLRIANTLAGLKCEQEADRKGTRGTGKNVSKTKAETFVERMFGSQENASRVRVFESELEDAKPLRHTRVRIDPWTGGALDGFLFTEEPVYKSRVEVRVNLDLPKGDKGKVAPGSNAERALLLLALRDLATGDLAVGGESGVGRGRFEVAPNSYIQTRFPETRLHVEKNGTIRVSPSAAFDADFEALHNELSGQ